MSGGQIYRLRTSIFTIPNNQNNATVHHTPAPFARTFLQRLASIRTKQSQYHATGVLGRTQTQHSNAAMWHTAIGLRVSYIENMKASTTLKLQNITTLPEKNRWLRPQVRSKQTLVKIGHVIPQICVCVQTDRQTDILITILHVPKNEAVIIKSVGLDRVIK